MDRRRSRFTRSLFYGILVFPLWILAEVAVTLFDMVGSRYLVALLMVGIVWLPLHLLFDAGIGYWLWPSLVFGVFLCGLWDRCEIFTARRPLSRLGIVRPPDRGERHSASARS